jgi:peroxiredoxin/TolB-like protein
LAFSQKSTIAILPFDAAGISSDEVTILTNQLSSEIYKLGEYTVIERSKMDLLLKEQGFQQAVCNTSECAIVAGKLLGVEKIIVGTIGRLGTLITISARIVDVQSGMIENNLSKEVSGSIETLYLNTIPEVATILSNRILNLKVEAPDFVLSDIDGIKYKLTDYVGKNVEEDERKVVVLFFSATWDKPGNSYIQEIQKLYLRNKGKIHTVRTKLLFFFIDITEATRQAPGFENSPKAEPYFRDKGITIPILYDNDGTVMNAYGVATIPKVYVVDKNQIARFTYAGYDKDKKEADSDRLRKVIKILLAQ